MGLLYLAVDLNAPHPAPLLANGKKGSSSAENGRGRQSSGRKSLFRHAKSLLEAIVGKPDADRAIVGDDYRPLDQRGIFLEQQRPFRIALRRLARLRQRAPGG